MDVREQGSGMFRTSRLDQKRSSHGFVIILIASFAIVGWAWFLFRSGFWDVASVDTGKLTVLYRGEVLRDVDQLLDNGPFRPWHSRNLLMLNQKALAEALKKTLFVDDVTVEKSYPNVLRLKIVERQRSVVVATNDQFINVDASGAITGPTDGSTLETSRAILSGAVLLDASRVPVILVDAFDTASSTTGTSMVSSERVRQWLDDSRALIQAGVKYSTMEIEAPESSTARFKTSQGYLIYVDLLKPIQDQIETYRLFMKTKPDEKQIHEYLDIRVNGKIFIK